MSKGGKPVLVMGIGEDGKGNIFVDLKDADQVYVKSVTARVQTTPNVSLSGIDINGSNHVISYSVSSPEAHENLASKVEEAGYIVRFNNGPSASITQNGATFSASISNGYSYTH